MCRTGCGRTPACEPSFISQGHHGIDSGASKCGQVSGQERAGDQDRDRRAHREGIVRPDAKQERLQENRGLVGGSDSDQQSECGKHRDFTKDHPDDAATRGAQRHSNINFSGAARDRVGHGPIEADARHEQGEAAETRAELRECPFLTNRLIDAA
jgi:hypothetical protein